MKRLALIFALVSLFGCGPSYPITGDDGGRYRLISEAVEPSEENGWVGKVAAYERKGDDTRWIMTGDRHFVDTHRPL